MTDDASGTDEDYYALFHQIILPLAQEFQPQMIVIPAGFDASIYDQNLPTGTFYLFTIFIYICSCCFYVIVIF